MTVTRRERREESGELSGREVVGGNDEEKGGGPEEGEGRGKGHPKPTGRVLCGVLTFSKHSFDKM